MANTIQGIAERLREQREKQDPICESRKEQIPDTARIVEALDTIRSILLDQTLTQQLAAQLQVAHGLVTALIGAEKATEFVEELPEIRRCMALDIEAAFDGDPAAKSFGEIIASYPSALAVSTYRIAHALYQLGEPVVARIMAEDAHSRTGIDIHPGATIGCHFFIDHGTGVVIGETTVIGNRVKLYHGVTLGAFSNRHGRLDSGKKRHPTIEDDVTIFPNATILGGETVIGRNSMIGGNAWVTKPVPQRSRVLIEPPRHQIRPERGSDSDYDI